jgi:hypothetical protein
MTDPTVPKSSLENLPQSDNLVVQCASCRCAFSAHPCVTPNPIFLRLAGREFIGTNSAKEGDKVGIQTQLVTGDIFRASPPIRHDCIFFQKQLCGFGKFLAIIKLTGSLLSHQPQIPILGNILCFGEAFFVGAFASVPSG